MNVDDEFLMGYLDGIITTFFSEKFAQSIKLCIEWQDNGKVLMFKPLEDA